MDQHTGKPVCHKIHYGNHNINKPIKTRFFVFYVEDSTKRNLINLIYYYDLHV